MPLALSLIISKFLQRCLFRNRSIQFRNIFFNFEDSLEFSFELHTPVMVQKKVVASPQLYWPWINLMPSIFFLRRDKLFYCFPKFLQEEFHHILCSLSSWAQFVIVFLTDSNLRMFLPRFEERWGFCPSVEKCITLILHAWNLPMVWLSYVDWRVHHSLEIPSSQSPVRSAKHGHFSSLFSSHFLIHNIPAWPMHTLRLPIFSSAKVRLHMNYSCVCVFRVRVIPTMCSVL